VQYLDIKVGIPFGRYNDFSSAPIDANALGATVFCLFLETQGFNHQKMTSEQLKRFNENLENSQYRAENMVVHASYDLNLCEWDQRIRVKYQQRLLEELEFAEKMGVSLFNIHVGCCPNTIRNRKENLSLAVQMLSEVMMIVPNINLCLENSVGSGGRYGGQLEDIKAVIDNLVLKDPKLKHRLGFSLNIAHAFSYGYEFSNQKKHELFINEIDRILEIEKMMLLFFNDSKTGFKQRTDTHENIGKGRMGAEPFKLFLGDERFKHLPIILETPDKNLWKDEILFIKKQRGRSNHARL